MNFKKIIYEQNDYKVIVINETINLKKYEMFRDAYNFFLDKGAVCFDLFINTAGGYMTPCARIGNLILDNFSKIKVRAVANRAYSGGLTILEACPWRTLLPDGKIKIHRARPISEDGSSVSPNDPKFILSEKKMFELFAFRIDQPVSKIYELADQARSFTAQQALEGKWIDEILNPKKSPQDPFFKFLKRGFLVQVMDWALIFFCCIDTLFNWIIIMTRSNL